MYYNTIIHYNDLRLYINIYFIAIRQPFSSEILSDYTVDTLISRMLIEMTPFVKIQLQKELSYHRSNTKMLQPSSQLQMDSQLSGIQNVYNIKQKESDTQKSFGKRAEIIKKVIQKIHPTISQITDGTLKRSSGKVDNYNVVLKSIVSEVEPIALNLSINALKIHPDSSIINIREATNQILSELRPLLVETVREEVERKNLEYTEDDIVKIVTEKIKGNFVRVIKRVIASSNETKTQNAQAKLINKSIAHLKRVAAGAVQKSLDVINARGINENALTNRIVSELVPFVKNSINQEWNTFKLQEKSSPTTVVGSVIQEVWPDVVNIVKETVEIYESNSDKSGNLIESILFKLRFVIRDKVERTLKKPENKELDGEALRSQIIKELKSLLLVGDIKEGEVFQPDFYAIIDENIMVEEMKI